MPSNALQAFRYSLKLTQSKNKRTAYTSRHEQVKNKSDQSHMS